MLMGTGTIDRTSTIKVRVQFFPVSANMRMAENAVDPNLSGIVEAMTDRARTSGNRVGEEADNEPYS